MSCRACDRSKIAAPPRLASSSFRVDAGGSVAGKAMTVPGGPPVIQVDRGFWTVLDGPARAALVAHEIAHHEAPAACEHCTDARAGARLRHEGYSATATAAAFSRIVSSRPAARNALEGWAAADKAIAVKRGEHSGLLNTAESIAPARKGFRALDSGDRSRVRYADGTTDLFRTGSGSTFTTAADDGGTSEGAPDVDGTSFENPATIDELLRRSPTPSKPRAGSTAPRVPPPTTTPPAPLSTPSSSTMLLIAGAVIVGAVFLLKR